MYSMYLFCFVCLNLGKTKRQIKPEKLSKLEAIQHNIRYLRCLGFVPVS